jgi:aspartate-semialdehyde dehydrogenase
MSLRSPNLAVVGATGAVGTEMISCLEQRQFPLSRLRLFASARSAGRQLLYRGRPLPVDVCTEEAFSGTDIALLSAGSAASRRFIPSAVRAGAIAIDNSSAFRMDQDVPLIVPEVNVGLISSHRGIISSPNCVAIIAVVALWPLHCAFGLRRPIASTYQAASGAGAAAMEELRASTRAALSGQYYEPRALRHRYAFNLYSHDTAIDPQTGSNEEELKVERDLRKIMSLADLPISVTCIRVPVLRAHAISLTAEFDRSLTADAAREALGVAPGIRVVDDRVNNHFPMPIEASGQGEVLVGRLRQDSSDGSGHSLNLFVAGDQLLKGAALNTVQIAEQLLRS